MSRFPQPLSTPFVSSRDVDVITVSDAGETGRGYISGVEVFFFCPSAITTLPFKTHPLCVRLLRTRISRVQVHEGRSATHPFLLNFVRYPPSRRFLHDSYTKKIQTYAIIIGESIFLSREKSKFSRVISFERTIKNRKLRDRPRSLFYTLFKFALLIKKFKAHSFLQFIRRRRANQPLFQEEWGRRSFTFPADTLLNTSFYYAITGEWISLFISPFLSPARDSKTFDNLFPLLPRLDRF